MEEKIVAPVIIDNINSSNEVFGVVSPLHITDQHEMFVDRDQQELIRLDFLYQYQPSPYQVIALLTFLLLFYNAKRLVGNHLAFYTSGSLLGALASILVFAYIIHKAVPKKMSIPFLVSGWPISAYVYYYLWQNFGVFAREYYLYMIVYLSIFMIISLAICYRVGPPDDQRSLNLVQWFIQFSSLIGIYLCSPNEKFAMLFFALIGVSLVWSKLVLIKNFISSAYNWLSEKCSGPQPRRLITEEEYDAEGVEYTRQALEELRGFCLKSPPSKSWRVVSKLHNSSRMSSFIACEADHISVPEMWEHSTAFDEGGFDSDEDDDYEKTPGTPKTPITPLSRFSFA